MYGLLAHLWWGFVAIYFKLLSHVESMYVLAERVVWSVAFLVILIGAMGVWRDALAVMRNRRVLTMLAFSTALLGVNWGTFIWAVTHGRALQASLGYFINPLVNVALGMIFLKERQRAGQLVGVGLATVGVVIVTIAGGQLPVVALAVSFSFAGYALIRKLTPVGPLIGVGVETLLLLPVALGYIVFRKLAEPMPIDAGTRGVLMLAGVVTVVPLLAFTAAARRLRLSTMGFLQYIGPTCQFLVAVLLFREPFDRRTLAGFVCIWIALVVYSIDSVRGYRETRGPVEVI